MNRLLLTIVILATGLVGHGCGPTAAPPPTTIGGYEKLPQGGNEVYPRQVILLHNIQRVLDADLPVKDRMDSLALTDRLVAANDPDIMSQIGVVLTQPNCPPELHKAALQFLLKRNYPGLAGYVARGLPTVGKTGNLQEAMLEWLSQHPEPAVLGEVIKMWSAEPKIDGPFEVRYRMLVETITKKPWDQALMESVDTPEFGARWASMDVLSRRLGSQELRRRIKATRPVTEAMGALQFAVDLLDFVPATGLEFRALLLIYRQERDSFLPVARLADSWTSGFGYRFNIRDFHLLSRLTHDPLKANLGRAQLIDELTRAFSAREHLPGTNTAFAAQVDRLNAADFWNLYLINRMLSRPRIQMALRVMAARDLADRTSVWGGLIFYENGQAEAKLYPADRENGENDFEYIPSQQLRDDEPNSMCRFIAHFEKTFNSSRSAPTESELKDARDANHYGLILTSINENTFTAHYFNPQGVVISLGVFPFLK